MTNADKRIDRILHGLNAAEVPARLEQRVMARVAQRTVESAEVQGSRYVRAQASIARLSPYAVGAAVAVVVCAAYVALLSHHAPRAMEQAQARRDVVAPKAFKAGLRTYAVHGLHSAVVPPIDADAVVAQPVSADDPDAIALTETLAPSHPAPPMPATPQELTTMRRGSPRQSVEMAELHASNDPGFQTARERATIRQYILGLLDPLVTAQNLTSSPPSADDSPQQAPPDTVLPTN